jgi:hypothetical protein
MPRQLIVRMTDSAQRRTQHIHFCLNVPVPLLNSNAQLRCNHDGTDWQVPLKRPVRTWMRGGERTPVATGIGLQKYRDFIMYSLPALIPWCGGLSDQGTDNEDSGSRYRLYVDAIRLERALRVGAHMELTACVMS